MLAEGSSQKRHIKLQRKKMMNKEKAEEEE